MPPIPLPPAKQLSSRVDKLSANLGRTELALSKLSFISNGPNGQVTATATGVVSIASITVDAALMSGGPAVLAGLIKSACSSALQSANARAKADFLAVAALLTFSELPAPATFEPPLYDGFATGVTSLLAHATKLEPKIRGMMFEGRSGSVVAVVDGQLELQSVSIIGALNATPREIELMATTAINEAIDKAKRLADVGITRITDAAAGRRGFAPALFVADSLNLGAADRALMKRLESLGFAVSVAAAMSVQAAQTEGKSLVVISETTFSPEVGDRLNGVAVPMLVMEPAIFDGLGMTGDAWQTDQGDRPEQTALTIMAPTHPLAAGLSGTITVASAPTKFVWGNPAASSAKIASLQGRTNAFGIFAYEAGVQMVGQTAPAKRVGWFAGRAAPTVFNDNAWHLFDAAVRWLTSQTAIFVVKAEPLSPGDVAIHARLCGALGFMVNIKTGVQVQASDTEGARLVVISESAESDKLVDRLKNIAAAALIMEPAVFDDFKMTGNVWQTDTGDAENKTAINIDLAAHPLAAEQSGLVTVLTTPNKFVWGKPTASAAKVASIPGIPGAAAIFAYEKGAVMKDNFVAPGRRVGWFAGRETPVALNTAGWSLFDAAVRWCVQRRALLVVPAVPLTPADSLLFARLRERFGFAVEVVTGAAVQTSQAVGMNVVVISESIQSDNIGDRLKNIPVPVVCLEPALFDDFGMTGGAWQSEIGDALAQTMVTIAASSHPLAAGLSGAVVVAGQRSTFVWGQPTSAAAKVAHITGQTNRWAVFAYEKAAQMKTLAAPERRVGFFPHRETPLHLTANGWRLFDAAVSWASKAATVADVAELEFLDLFGR